MRPLTARLEIDYCSINVANHRSITIIRFVAKSYVHLWKSFTNRPHLILHTCKIFLVAQVLLNNQTGPWSHIRAAPKGQACMIHGIMHAHCNTELLYHILLYVFNMLYTCMSRVGEEMYTILLKLHGFQTHCVRNAICTIHMVHFFYMLATCKSCGLFVFFSQAQL